ncbi:uncharacterized protein LOC109852985 [Pseudomyrmex gracilis]|uniref:uncharacterized protein LOC109852985 n=1 Tax=Pseudomyrmex gracilis TaxID=219809 RepID=UPI0009952C74|nr:uncharacterized protein LOC109852985 [Pseudomyrmex gracilis]
MVLLQCIVSTILLFSGVTSEGAYSPYENIQLEFSNTPKLIYTSSESNPAISGYTYTTQHINGGSNVIFTTGADSVDRMRNGMNSMKIPDGDAPNKLQTNLISSEEQSEVMKASTSKQEDYNSNDAVTVEAKQLSQNSGADNNLVEHQQASLQPVSLVRVSPYPALRANLLPISTYHVPSNLQTQFYSSNSHLELPLSNIGFYNPAVPLFYQGTIGVSNNSFKHASTVAEDVKVSTKSQITKNSQNDARSDSIYSNVIKSRSFEPNKVEETNRSATSTNKFESTVTSSERIKQKTSSSELVNHAEKSESSVEQTNQDKASNTEFESTKINPSTSASTTKKCKCD